MKKHYRVLSHNNGSYYTIQERFLFLFWITIQQVQVNIYDWSHWEEDIHFNSYEDAINYLIAINNNVNITNIFYLEL